MADLLGTDPACRAVGAGVVHEEDVPSRELPPDARHQLVDVLRLVAGGHDHERPHPSEPVKKSPKLNLGTVLEFNFGDFFTGAQSAR